MAQGGKDRAHVGALLAQGKSDQDFFDAGDYGQHRGQHEGPGSEFGVERDIADEGDEDRDFNAPGVIAGQFAELDQADQRGQQEAEQDQCIVKAARVA